MSTTRILASLTLLAAIAAVPLPAVAAQPSFNCDKPANAAEEMICKDDQLAALDRETERLFRLARDGASLTPDKRKELVAIERGFIKGRDDCSKADDKRACVITAYVTRISELRQDYPDVLSGDAMGASVGPFAMRCPGIDADIAASFINIDPMYAYLSWPGNSLVFTQAQSGSGARYTATTAAGTAEFWQKGPEATLTMPGKPQMTCSIKATI
ncbi:MliC family protein [Flaviflagellibacter deserti]|uniref:MliC family protein n=1 Tax=Flaviflagellibacter deserti TaxID=2267266 RepID=A0ABV9YZP3_9HYPH